MTVIQFPSRIQSPEPYPPLVCVGIWIGVSGICWTIIGLVIWVVL